MKPVIWIIDDEFDNYDIEKNVIKQELKDAEIIFSGRDFLKELDTVGKKADAVITQISMDINASVIEKLEHCKIISVYGVGYENVDVEAASDKGILVANAPTYCTEDVSDYVIAAIYQCNKTLMEYAKSCKGGPWGAMAAKNLIHRIKGSVLFIIGLGRIGAAVAEKANVMGMEVLCYDPYVSEEKAKKINVTKVELEEGLEQADFVSMNMRLTKETEGFANKRCFELMKPSAYLINASRGGTVNEADLIDAVKNGWIAGACLDVLCEEPPKPDNPIINTEGIFVTPHISYLTQSSLDELQRTAAENVVNCLLQREVKSIINV